MLLLLLLLTGLLPLSSVAAETTIQKNSYDLALSTEEQQYLKQKQQLKVCVDPDAMPFEKIENGQHIGLASDFMHLFAQRLKTPIVLVPSLTWLDSIELGKQRQCDIFSFIMGTPDRERYLDFTDVYLSFPLVVAVGYQQDFINNIEDILDKNLGIQKGYAYAELLRYLYPAIDLVEVDSLNEGLDMVSRNKLYGMIGSLPDISYAFQKQYIGELKIAGKLEQQLKMSVGTRNDEPLLVEIFNKVIAQLSERERQEIINDWIAIKYESKTDYSLLIRLSVIFGLVLMFFLYHYWQLKKFNYRLRHLSITDKLTDINNRMKLDQKLDDVFHLARRYQHEFSIILIDIDHFKRINDEYGHLTGDYALKSLAQILSSNIRSVDTLGRWGGEEFLIICPEQTVDGGRLMAEKLRALVAEFQFEHFTHLSCSFGVAAFAKDQTVDVLLKRADKALYRAKNQGRNQVRTN